MPKDKAPIPPFGGLTLGEAEKLKKLGGVLTPGVTEALSKQREALRRIGGWNAGPSLREAEEARELLTSLRQETPREMALRAEIAAARQKTADLEAALQKERAARLATLREVETWAAEKFGARPSPARPPAAAAHSLPSEPEPIDPPEPSEEEQDGSQTELTRTFFQEEYGGPPPKKLGYRPLHARMKEWVAKKNGSDNGNRRVASETTIRNVRKTL